MALRLAGRVVPVTDLTPISTIRQLLRLWVEEFVALWRGVSEQHDQWFIGSAKGPDLDRRLADFGITARPGAVTAYGQVSIAASSAVDVTAGTILRTRSDVDHPVKRYQVQPNLTPVPVLGDVGDESWHVNAGSARLVHVVALSSGAAGNTAAGTIVEAENPIAGATAITNPAAILNGADAYDDAQTRDWFHSWLRSLAGGTRGAIAFALREYADPVTGRRVKSHALQEWDGASLLNVDGRNVALVVYVDEGIGGGIDGAATADSSLVAAVAALFEGAGSEARPGIRAAGVPAAVVAAKARLVNIAVRADVEPNASSDTMRKRISAAAQSFVGNLPVAGQSSDGTLQGQLQLARLSRAIADVPGVLRVTIDSPQADVAIPVGWRAAVGALTVAATPVT